MAKLILQETQDGAKLVAYVLGVLDDPEASRDDRRWAVTWLMDRGIGKPVATVEMNHSVAPSLPPDWSTLSPGQRAAWLDAHVPLALGPGGDS